MRVLRLLGWLLVAAVLSGTLLHRTGRTDLVILLEAASNLLHGLPVYDPNVTNENTKPPLAVLLFTPLTWFPHWMVRVSWDLMNLGVFLWVGYRLSAPHQQRQTLWLLGTLWCLNAWNTEVRLGQYNMLCLALVLQGTRSRPWVSGSLGAIAVLLKPTMAILALWAGMSCTPAKARLQWLLGGVGMVTALTLVFLMLWGNQAFWQLHQDWLAILDPAADKHLLRPDNVGLPSLLGSARWGGLLFASALAAQGALHAAPRSLALGVGCISVLLVSPMSWPQNYVLLLPVFIWAWSQWRRPLVKTALVVAYLGLQLVNPTLCGAGWCQALPPRVPLWTLLVVSLLLGAELLWRFWREKSEAVESL